MNLARDVVRDFSDNMEKTISVDLILNIVAKAFNLSSDLLISKTRKREIVLARQIAMYFATRFTHLTLKAIGLHFGGRDHSTVIHSRENVKFLISKNDPTAELIKELHRKLELASF